MNTSVCGLRVFHMLGALHWERVTRFLTGDAVYQGICEKASLIRDPLQDVSILVAKSRYYHSFLLNWKAERLSRLLAGTRMV